MIAGLLAGATRCPARTSITRSYKILAGELRNHMTLDIENELWKVRKLYHVKPGKGGAFVQAEMKNLETKTKRNERFRVQESLELAEFDDSKEVNFLYRDGSKLAMMHPETFEQLEVDVDLCGETRALFLDEGMPVKLHAYKKRFIGLEFGPKIEAVIKATEPYMKGAHAAGILKPAELEGGGMVRVPQHLESGDRVIVNVDDEPPSYVGRAQ